MKTSKKYTKKQITEAIAYWKKQLNESYGKMNAYDFLLELLMTLQSIRTEFYVECDSYDFSQWFNIDYSKVDHTAKTVILGATIVEDDSPEKYLSTIESLCNWYKENSVKHNYRIVFEDSDGDQYYKVDVRSNKVILY